MRLYISGIEGTGMGPLALMAKAAGFSVYGSDLEKGAIHDELIKEGIDVEVGTQDGRFLKSVLDKGIDWFCYTSALPDDHPELVLARESGVKITKRDDLTAFLVKKLNLKMVAIAGTHGKTTTTAMIVWTALKLGLPVSYLVGTKLGFALSGSYKTGDKYFIYEADEYDRNFLKYEPWLAVIPSISYDHPDIYPTKKEYEEAFDQFKRQSRKVIDTPGYLKFNLVGSARRKDAGLAAAAILEILKDEGSVYDFTEIVRILNEFPGVGRRFERISDGVYTDYAHHPEEIAATVEAALEEAHNLKKKGVVVIYQPHQNTRQHEVFNDYKDAFVGVSKIFWLPTYLTRENQELKIYEPKEFIETLSNKEVGEPAELDDLLAKKINGFIRDGYLVILMTAGIADKWFREKIVIL